MVDQGLVEQALAGDARAMDALLTEVRPVVAKRARRMLPHPEDAEEATQDALLAIATKLHTWSGRGSFEGWVSVIAANQARMTYRSLRRRFVERGLDVVPETVDPIRTSVVAGTRLDLLDALEGLEGQHPETVEPFVMRELGGMSYDEIAELTGTKLGTVKARIHTARGFVRQRL